MHPLQAGTGDGRRIQKLGVWRNRKTGKPENREKEDPKTKVIVRKSTHLAKRSDDEQKIL